MLLCVLVWWLVCLCVLKVCRFMSCMLCVGAFVGVFVGVFVGAFVGVFVGVFVGALVGACVVCWVLAEFVVLV